MLASSEADGRYVVAVCICTYRRPQGLARVLDGIGALAFTRVPPPSLHVIIADNEGSPETRRIAEAFAGRSGLPLTYVAEQRRGISHARNACLDHVPVTADFVAFIDDDEKPRADWLEELIVGIERAGSEAISGPYEPVYEALPPDWFRIGRFFASPRRKTCNDFDEVSFLVMGNLLVRGDFLRAHPVRFDPRLGLVGGEDRKFLLDIKKLGGRFSWTGRAVTEHFVSADRMRFAYILKREFGVGCAASVLLRIENHRPIDRVAYAAANIGKFVLKLCTVAPTMLMKYFAGNQYETLKPIFDLVNLGGRAYGLIGLTYELYAVASEPASGNAARMASVVSRQERGR